MKPCLERVGQLNKMERDGLIELVSTLVLKKYANRARSI